MIFKTRFPSFLLLSAAACLQLTSSGCSGANPGSAPLDSRELPPAPSFLRPTVTPKPRENDDAVVVIARYQASEKINAQKIICGAQWIEAVRKHYTSSAKRGPGPEPQSLACAKRLTPRKRTS